MQFTKGHLVGVFLLVALSGLFIYAATYIGGRIQNATDAPSDIERTLSLSGLTLEDGAALDLTQLEGKVVIVAAWATWCPSCQQMLFDLARAEERFGADLEVIAVNRAEETSVVRDYKSAFSLPNTISYVNDPEDAYFNSISGRSMPEMIIYTREGIVAEHRIDAPSFDVLMTTLDSLITR